MTDVDNYSMVEILSLVDSTRGEPRCPTSWDAFPASGKIRTNLLVSFERAKPDGETCNEARQEELRK